MIVTWIAIQCQPLPWEDLRRDVAYVACGERAGELSLVRSADAPKSPAIDRLLDSLEHAVSMAKTTKGAPDLAWLPKAMPDQGTSIRLSAPRRCQARSYEEQLGRLASS